MIWCPWGQTLTILRAAFYVVFFFQLSNRSLPSFPRNRPIYHTLPVLPTFLFRLTYGTICLWYVGQEITGCAVQNTVHSETALTTASWRATSANRLTSRCLNCVSRLNAERLVLFYYMLVGRSRTSPADVVFTVFRQR